MTEPTPVPPATGETFAEWIRARGISEVECLVPDINGVVRGKVFPPTNSYRLPAA